MTIVTCFRYATEKEIRGSTYHVHHRIWVAGEEEGAPSDGKTVLTPGVTFNNVRRRLRPKYDVPGESSELRPSTSSVVW